MPLRGPGLEKLGLLGSLSDCATTAGRVGPDDQGRCGTESAQSGTEYQAVCRQGTYSTEEATL